MQYLHIHKQISGKKAFSQKSQNKIVQVCVLHLYHTQAIRL